MPAFFMQAITTRVFMTNKSKCLSTGITCIHLFFENKDIKSLTFVKLWNSAVVWNIYDFIFASELIENPNL